VSAKTKTAPAWLAERQVMALHQIGRLEMRRLAATGRITSRTLLSGRTQYSAESVARYFRSITSEGETAVVATEAQAS